MDQPHLVVRDHLAPRHGAYCPFTGRAVRPWSQRAMIATLEVLLALGLLLHGLELGSRWLGAAGALGAGIAFAAAFATARVAPRARAVALAAVALVAFLGMASAIARAAPLGAEGLGGWAGRTVAALTRADEWCLQAFGVRCYPVLAGALGAVALGLLLVELTSAWRVRHLPRRLWFARVHPVWRRSYLPHESAHRAIGVLAIESDPLLADKLLFVELPEDGAALRFAAGPELGARASQPFVPLAGLAKPSLLWLERGHVHLRGDLDGAGPAELRLFLRRLQQAPRDRAPDAPHAPVAALAIADQFAADDALFAKRYARPPAKRLFGLLLDSRPAPDGPLPRFTTLLLVDGRGHAERPHPDLLGPPRHDAERDRLLVPWRSEGDEPLTLEFERGRDQVVAVRARGELYHLLFVAFGGPRP